VKGAPIFLNVGANYPNALLTVVIWPEVRKQFESAPDELFKVSKVWIIGKLELYEDQPEIAIKNFKQIYPVVAPPSIRQHSMLLSELKNNILRQGTQNWITYLFLFLCRIF
jgi:hypothetical protein